MTIADKLRKVLSTKNALKQALIDKGVEISDTDDFASYVGKIEGITGGGGVPKGFIELEYLEKTAQTNDYLDLRVTANINTSIELEFSANAWVNNSSAQPQALFGHQGGNSRTSFGLFANYFSSSTPNTRYVYGADLGTRTSVSTPTTVPNTIYKYKLGGGELRVNGELVDTYTEKTDMTTGYLWLFRINAVSSVSSYYSTANACVYGKVYSLKIYDGDELIHDFVPAQRKDTLALGLYDKITGYFRATNTANGFTGVAK